MNMRSTEVRKVLDESDSTSFRAETIVLCIVAICGVVVFLVPFKWWLWTIGSTAGLYILLLVALKVLSGEVEGLILGWVLLFPLGYYFLSFPREKPLITLDRMEAGLLLLGAFFAPHIVRPRLPAALRKAAAAWLLFLLACCFSLIKIGSTTALLSSARVLVDAFVIPAVMTGYIVAWFPVRRYIPQLHALTCVVAAYLAAIGIAEVAMGEDLLPLPGAGLYHAGADNLFLRVNGPFQSNNSYGLIGLLMLWFLVFLRWTMRDTAVFWPQKLLHKVGLIGATIAACLPLFRSIFLTLGLIFLLEAWINRRQWHGVARVVVLIVAASLFLSVRFLVPELYEERVSGGDNLYARLAQQKQNLNVFLHNPIFGVGIGNFNQAAPKLTVYSGVASGIDPLDYPHNNLAAVLAETGVVGFIPYMAANIFLALAYWDLRIRCGSVGAGLWKYAVFLFLSYWISGLALTSGYYGDLNIWYLFVLAIVYRYGLTTIPRTTCAAS